MIHRVIQWTLLCIWLLAWFGCLSWFLRFGGYLTVHQISFFIAGLGLGSIARRLLADDPPVLSRLSRETRP